MIVVLACLAAVALALPNEFKRGLDGSPLVIEYDVGTHQHIQTGDAGNAVRGSYSYLSSDGSEHIVNYIADENGYRVISGNRPVSSPQFTLVPVVTKPIEITEPVEIAEPAAVTAELTEIADPPADVEPNTVAESTPAPDNIVITEEVADDEPAVTEATTDAEPELAQPAVPVIQSDKYAVPSGYKLVPISYGSLPYPYRYNQYQGYPYGFSDGLHYYQGGYSLPFSYGYGYNAGQIGGYVLKPAGSALNAAKQQQQQQQQQLQEQYRNQFNIPKQFQLYQGQFEQQSYPYGNFVYGNVPKQRVSGESSV